jgi:hypothetical protein
MKQTAESRWPDGINVAYAFGSLVFTPVIKALQKRYGSRRQYAKRENSSFSPDSIGPSESQFLAEADSFYMSSVGATGWPYVQHRGGPKGFLKVIDECTVAFADFRGNKQYISSAASSGYLAASRVPPVPGAINLGRLPRARTSLQYPRILAAFRMRSPGHASL